ncbi:MAG: thiamine diphosphokinase [Anaerolineaceae bacterium]|jgi:thiamine pyrophosphokinase|nr:MAG: thiamine diphosphokinase [Anaerolineaceae bacterium]
MLALSLSNGLGTESLPMRIIIFANGDLPNLEKAGALIRPDDFILCADGGTRHALALGLVPNVIIGDMDSLPSNFQPSTFNGELILFPKDKNETDLELALNHALTLNPDEILILAALGGRLDQTLANIALLSNLQLATFNIKLTDGVEEIFFCRDQVQVEGRSGDIVSLIPWQGEVTGVFTENLRWQLHHETLYPDKTRGISNEMTSDVTTVMIKSGLLLVVHSIGDT